MLGGNGHDFIAAFITGGLSMVLLKQLGGYRPSAFWENALSGAAIGALAIFAVRWTANVHVPTSL